MTTEEMTKWVERVMSKEAGELTKKIQFTIWE